MILAGMKLEELESLMAEMNATKFRAKQIHNWIYSKSVSSIEEMTNLSKDFREELKKVATVTDTKIKVKQVSKDGTIKYLVEYPDGECVETVLMRFDNRANLTACVSSQVGCAVNCSFCATGKGGFKRNLTYKEIIEQVLTIQRDTGLKVTNIVFMGQGEPLLNLDNVLKALEIFNDDFQCLEKFFDDFFKSGWVDFIFGMYYNLINTQISCIIYTKERVNDIIGRT